MPVEVQCGECFASFRVRDELLGKKVRCKECGAVVQVVCGRHEPEKPARRESKRPADETELPIGSNRLGHQRRAKAKRGKLGVGLHRKIASAIGSEHPQVMVGALLALLVLVTEIPCFIVALRNYDFSLTYYRTVLYLALPATVVVLVLYSIAMRRELGPEPDYVRLLRWLGLAACIGVPFLPNDIRKPVMTFVLAPLGLLVAYSSMGHSGEFRKRYPVFNSLVMLLPISLLLPFGHLIHAAMMRERRPQEAVETLLPFLKGVL